MPQLRDIYGRDGAAALASQPQTWIVLRSVEPETAKWLESALGEYETEEFKESVALGGGNARTGGIDLPAGAEKEPDHGR